MTTASDDAAVYPLTLEYGMATCAPCASRGHCSPHGGNSATTIWSLSTTM